MIKLNMLIYVGKTHTLDPSNTLYFWLLSVQFDYVTHTLIIRVRCRAVLLFALLFPWNKESVFMSALANERSVNIRYQLMIFFCIYRLGRHTNNTWLKLHLVMTCKVLQTTSDWCDELEVSREWQYAVGETSITYKGTNIQLLGADQQTYWY